MQDNGLMKYYRGLKRGKNLLDTNAHKDFFITEEDVPAEYIKNKKITNLLTPEGKFYVKRVDKKERDAEILISQIYEKLGLKSAIYLPAGDNKRYEYVVSNDVKTPNTVIARNHTVEMMKRLKGKENYLPIESPLYLPEDYDRINVDYSKFITNEGMKDLQLKRIVDCICEDCDGHDLNYFYVLNEQGLIESTVTIDHSMAGRLHGDMLNAYQNEFSNHALSRDGIIRHIQYNETLHSFITPREIINTVTSVDVPEIARDIKSEIGYKVDTKFVSDIDKSFDDFAESLIKA